mmetsp:Transcript_85724/g.154347  ORF Transcript_85724/g.154347 Transcript_85724/m.154347 type:complete len:202 (+) Transcript_85724:201-806(+)
MASCFNSLSVPFASIITFPRTLVFIPELTLTTYVFSLALTGTAVDGAADFFPPPFFSSILDRNHAFSSSAALLLTTLKPLSAQTLEPSERSGDGALSISSSSDARLWRGSFLVVVSRLSDGRPLLDRDLPRLSSDDSIDAVKLSDWRLCRITRKRISWPILSSGFCTASLPSLMSEVSEPMSCSGISLMGIKASLPSTTPT